MLDCGARGRATNCARACRSHFCWPFKLLSAKQRATLILRDGLGFPAAEYADLLGVSEAAANSSLQRARATLSSRSELQPVEPAFDDSTLLERYIQAAPSRRGRAGRLASP